MTIISSKAFNARPAHFLGMARRGEHVGLRSRGGIYRIVFEPYSNDEHTTLDIPKRDVTAEICQAMKDWRDELNGIDTGKFQPAKELIDELRDIETQGL